MTSIDENDLSMLLLENVDLRLIEPHIFSVLWDIEVSSTYDTQFGYIYDWVACNPIYNRLMWGYSITIFASIANDALRSTNKGNVLDLGCGSLAFTAKTYIQYSERPVILVDQSFRINISREYFKGNHHFKFEFDFNDRYEVIYFYEKFDYQFKN